MSKSDIQMINEELHLNDVFSNSEAIEGVKKTHFWEVIEGITKTCKLSKTNYYTLKPKLELAIKIGEWVLVQYDGEHYPGEVKAIENNDYSVSVMIKAGRNWKWPSNEDKNFYSNDKIVKKLSAPDVVNARGHYSFNELK
ncbi:hypothetical protein JTE90_012093 [Oedothorax gibbosus]|uniref:Uncharacterized protein n=1 Tax=Oedothorax gibbosus TaxID=931172 RepID=A0AAV6UK79_9ARAC|nr:hypothetical protein JTE90_012093 [Oedothorax gibbosus]